MEKVPRVSSGRMFVALLGGIFYLLSVAGHAAEQRSLAFTRHDGEYWQVWTCSLRDAAPRQLTRSPDDKRSLHADPGTRQLFFRTNGGDLYVYHLDTGKDPVRLFGAMPPIKDHDFLPGRGHLVSAYAANAKDNLHIWFHSASNDTRRLLITDPHLNEMPRWIPDGKRFVYVVTRKGKSHIKIADIAGASPRQLFGNALQDTLQPAPSPDGTELAFCTRSARGGDLWRARLDDRSDPQELYAGPGLECEPAWSPDGTLIAFSTWDGANFRIATIRRDGSGFRYITPEGIDCRCPTFIADIGR